MTRAASDTLEVGASQVDTYKFDLCRLRKEARHRQVLPAA
jgi:hypothetical protein